MIVALLSKKKIQQLAVAFVDDTSLYSNRDRVEQNMQTIVDTYRQLHETTGGSIQCEKSFYFA